jgi:hypothetical protein
MRLQRGWGAEVNCDNKGFMFSFMKIYLFRFALSSFERTAFALGRYELKHSGGRDGCHVGMWLKDAELELGSNAWAGVEDFNWLKKIAAVAVHAVPNVVAPMLTVTILFCVRFQFFLEEKSPNWSISPEEERRNFDLEG